MLDDDEDGALLLDEPEPEGELPDAAPEGEVLEPLAALPPLLLGGVPEALELDEPPEAGAVGEALDELEELLSFSVLLVSADEEPEAEPEAEPDGAVEDEPDGEVVEPADEDDEPGDLAVFGESPQAVAPSARDIAAARMESLI